LLEHVQILIRARVALVMAEIIAIAALLGIAAA
jgi:hypothetical protein